MADKGRMVMGLEVMVLKQKSSLLPDQVVLLLLMSLLKVAMAEKIMQMILHHLKLGH